MSKKMILLLVLIAAGFGVWKLVISFKKGGRLSDAAVERFHADFNAGAYANIYQASAPGLRDHRTVGQFSTFLSDLHTKLGAHQSGTRVGLKLNTVNSHTTMTADCPAMFEKGPAIETFVFDYDGDAPTLLDYHVDSIALPSNPK